MITITYDPLQGQVVPDGEVAAYVTNVIREHIAGSVHDYDIKVERTVGSGSIINEFRLRVARQELSHTSLQFVFDHQTMTVNEYAVLYDWPKGFADLDDRQVSEILICALKRRRNQKAKEQS